MGEANEDGGARNSEFSEEELDLSLGLSLGGRYSQSPEQKPIIRTSSLNGGLAALNENDGGAGAFLSLARSSSLPTEAEQELKKLKEMQATKRMEAKKRLLEKHNRRGGGGYNEEKKYPAVMEGKLANWTIESAADNPAFRRAIEKMRSHVSPSTSKTIRGQGNSTAAKIHPNSQSRATSKATENGNSVNPANYYLEPVANFEAVANGKSTYPASHRSPPLIKLEKMANAKPVINPANPHHSDSLVSLRKRANGKSVAEQERPSKKGKVPAKGNHYNSTMEMMRLMPSVTATGDGPNGRKIEGVLYKYVTERVRIVCVCHGRFLSPAEFVKHAGGTDVENPMKHISVLPATL